MSVKYLAEFYGYRPVVRDQRRPDAAVTSVERNIQARVLAGNLAYFQQRYAEALEHYLAAWGLLPTLVDPRFPGIVAKVADDVLLSLDLATPLLSTSVAVHRLRDAVGPRAPVLAPEPAPDELLELTERFAGKADPGRSRLAAARAHADSGNPELAERAVREAIAEGGDDRELVADAHALLGVLRLRAGRDEEAQGEFDRALGVYQGTAQADGVAAMQYNLGVALTSSGRAEAAGELFAVAAAHAPQGLAWQVTHSLNPGIAAVSRTMGQAGLPFLIKADGGWEQLASGNGQRAKHAVTVLRDGAAVTLDLDRGAARQLREQLYDPRIDATSLPALDPLLWDPLQFVSYLTHVGGFVLPLALADTYAALGDHQKAIAYYLKVRDYPFLNLSIERPVVWAKAARAHLALAQRLYRDGDMTAARGQYEQVVRVTSDGSFELAGPLYAGAFAALTGETLAFLQAEDKTTFTAMDHTRRLLLLEALTNLRQILAGINYLGFAQDIIPVHSWRYLQNVARYLTNQAMQAERAYISFAHTAEKEAFTRQALEQAVDAQAAAVDVEIARIEAARAQREAAALSADLARTRRANAIEQRAEYESVSQQLAYLDEIVAFTNASGIRDTKIRINSDWAAALGISAGRYDPNILIQLLTRQRSQITRTYELHNMDRQIQELGGAVGVADSQVDVADRMVDVARGQRDLAELRLAQAKAQLEFFNGQEFTPELWDNLAQAQRQISARYLDWAIGAAFLMERAFEYQYDTEVNRIRFDYHRSELHGLLAADFLLADIDRFSFDRLLETSKRVPLKVSVPLAERYPFQFRQRFQRTGRMDFETQLGDFDRRYPGVHLARIRRVEVVVEGLIGPDGLHGTLTNSGATLVRDRSGGRRLRLGRPETLVLSRFDLRSDGFVFTTDEDVLEVFEGTGLAGGWIVEFPPEANDVDYAAITNIHLVFYAEGFHSDAVARMVRAELASTAVHQHTLGLALAFQYPDEFFGFQDSGSVTVPVDHAYLPFDHTDPTVIDLYLQIETADGVPAAGLTVSVQPAGAAAVEQASDANGMVGTGGTALDALRGGTLIGDWTIRIDPAANPGFDPEQVGNIFVFVEYGYTPRGRPAARDDFSSDPLVHFEVVDDPQATFGAPSAWVYDAAGRRVSQTSEIHAPDGPGALNTEPHKPGTYLVRETGADFAAQRDLLVRARVRSDDPNGIGLVFRYVDVDNFCFLLLDSQRGYRRLGHKVAGVFSDLEVAAVDTEAGYPVGVDLELTVAAVGDAVVACLDGEEILRGREQSLLAPGRVGFYAWSNPQAHFLDLEVRPI